MPRSLSNFSGNWRPLVCKKSRGLGMRQRSAQFLFRLISRRYQKGSIILTSNKSYGEWGDVVSDYVLATAMLDRLLHYSTTINIRGESYRLREKRKAGVFHDLTAKHAKGSSSPSRSIQEEEPGETNRR